MRTQLRNSSQTVYSPGGGDVLRGDKLVLAPSVMPFAATTDINFATNDVQTLALTGAVTFTTSGLAVGTQKTIRILCDGTGRAFTFPVGWIWLGAAAPAGITANKYALLTLQSFGDADADVVAAYSEQP